MRNILITEKSNVILENEQDEKSIIFGFRLVLTTLVIIFFGMTMLYSTSYGIAGSKYFLNQLIWCGGGLVVASLAVIFGYRRISDYSIPLVITAILLLAIADFCFPAVKGAHRWIHLKYFNIQPSEIAKLALAIYFSKYCAEHFRFINDLFSRQGPGKGIAVCGTLMLFVLIGKDLGTTILLAGVMLTILFCTGLRLRYILIPILGGGTALFFLIKHFSPVRWSRLTSFLDPELYQQGEGYQLWNSFLAFGSGNWFGLGFTVSRMKAKYLPEAHTDFIMSIVGEELGFACMLLVILAYLVFIYYGARISANARSRHAMLLGIGLTSIIGMQAAINIGVVCGAFPTKGMPAPFISYGGSNMMMCLAALGLLLSIALDTAMPDYNDDVIAYLKQKIPFMRGK